MTLIDFTLANARRFYSSMGNPLAVKGLTTNSHPGGRQYIPINALTAVGALMTLIDFTLSNAGRFYSSMGKPLAVKGLTTNSYPGYQLMAGNKVGRENWKSME